MEGLHPVGHHHILYSSHVGVVHHVVVHERDHWIGTADCWRRVRTLKQFWAEAIPGAGGEGVPELADIFLAMEAPPLA